MSTNIRQLKDPVSGDVFYPQTDIAGLVSGGGPGIDAKPTAGSVKLVQSGGVAAEFSKLCKMYAIKEFKDGYYQNKNTGEEVASSNFFIAKGFIVEGTEMLYVPQTVSSQHSAMGIVFYDINNNRLSGASLINEHNYIEAPSNAFSANITFEKSIYNSMSQFSMSRYSKNYIEIPEYDVQSNLLVGYIKPDGTANTTNPNFRRTDFIAINNLNNFLPVLGFGLNLSNATAIAFYSSANENSFIFSVIGDTAGNTWKTGALDFRDYPNAKYFRASIVGNGCYVKTKYVNASLPLVDSIGSANIQDDSVSFDKITFKEHYELSNFIDRAKLIPNKYINNDGVPTQTGSSDYHITDKVYLDENKSYYYGNIYKSYYAFYDENDTVVLASGTGGNLTNPFTVPTGAKYGRFTLNDAAQTGTCWISVRNIFPEDYREVIDQSYISPIQNDVLKTDVFPIEGVNLVNLSEIKENVLVNTSGEFATRNGYKGIEIDFCSTDVPIYVNIFYPGYYAILNAEGNVIQVAQGGTSDRKFYDGYRLPNGAVKGRFSIMNDVSQSDINNYAYISYGRPLMQDEINNRVAFKNSYSYKKQVRPTDYDGGDITAFSKILCIGDSLTFGVFNTNQSTSPVVPEMSYPSNLARITGCDVTNLGDSGETSASWWAAHQNDEALTGCKCVIIELGVNDNQETLDTISKDAFDNIINALKSRNQKVKIFLSGIPSGKSYKARLETQSYYIKDQWLKSYYNTYYANDTQVFFLDMVRYTHLFDKYAPSYSSTFDDYNQGHLSAYGYWRLAKDYANYISYIMHQSNTYFKYLQFIGTDYDYQ